MKIIKEKLIKKIIIIMVIFQLIFMPISNAFSMNDIFNEADKFLKAGENNGGQTAINQNQLKVEIGNVYNVIFVIGVALSVVIGVILGIKFMMGSVEEQAKIKEMLIPYVLGCIVVFAGFGIWKIVIEMADSVF